jgi:hypothetical protein
MTNDPYNNKHRELNKKIREFADTDKHPIDPQIDFYIARSFRANALMSDTTD